MNCSPEKMREVAGDFESFFLYQMLELTQPKDMAENKVLGGGYAEEVWRQQMNQQVANEISKNGGIGLGDTIYNQLVKLQEQYTGGQTQ